jgi:hypothetical protein
MVLSMVVQFCSPRVVRSLALSARPRRIKRTRPSIDDGAMLNAEALILVCSLAAVSNDCTRDNALDVVYVPATFESPGVCMMRAQAYVANSSIGRDLPKNEAFKVI